MFDTQDLKARIKRLPPPPQPARYVIRNRGLSWRWETADGTLKGPWRNTQSLALRALNKLQAGARYTVVQE